MTDYYQSDCSRNWESLSNLMGRQKRRRKMTKPKCKLTGTDGNVFALVGKVRECLRKAKQGDQAALMTKEVFASGSYGDALRIMSNYVDIS